MPPRFTPKPRKQRARREAANAAAALSTAVSNSSESSTTPTSADPNTSVLLPDSKLEREEKKRALKESLRREQQAKPSAKKQKRLDKYIENKLKRDENLEILRLLEGEKVREDERRRKLAEPSRETVVAAGTTSGMESGSGTKGRKGKRGWVEVEQPVEAVVKNKRRRTAHEVVPARDVGSDEEGSEDSFEEEHPEMFEEAEEEEGPRPVAAAAVQRNVGSGLAKPLEIGPDGLPVIETKPGRTKRRKVIEPALQKSGSADGAEDGEDSDAGSEWAGFSDVSEEEEDKQDVDEDERAKRMKIIQQILAQEEEEDIDSDEDSGQEDGSEESEVSDDDRSDEDEAEDSDDDTDPTSDFGSDSEASSSPQDTRLKPRASAFKAWATQALNKSLGHTPSYEAGNLPTQTAQPSSVLPTVSRPPTINPILKSIPAPTEPSRKAYTVHVERTPEIQASRSELPILQREQEIMEAIYNNPVVIIKGDTGSGKTTQIPQFLYEAGFGSPDGPAAGIIGITQPRRVAAVSMAKRVGDEMAEHGSKVAYQIRFDSNVSSRTAVKFMTDGILLRELSKDLLLKKYSVIVIDEAHERSVNTDILIGILSKVVPARMTKSRFNPDPKPLKLIIMSATLNLNDFLNDSLFDAASKPPIVEAEGRQHPVTTHFSLRSRADYVEEIVEKVRRAHRKLPRGGMLVFLTGQNEIRQVGERLQTMLGRSDQQHHSYDTKVQIASNEVPAEVEDLEIETYKSVKTLEEKDDFDEVEFVTGSDDEADEEDEFDISEEEDEAVSSDTHATRPSAKTPKAKDPYETVHILPLYSQLPTKQQLRVFDPPPENARLIVLATNVAETSLTIPGIRYVFDTGRSKERKYNLDTGVQSFEIDWISKASASQRAGRAGRTGPGHCWRLYTSAVYEQFFPEYAEPEILRAPVEGIVLQLKSFDYPKPVAQFPFPSSPSTEMLVKAEKLLKNLGALSVAGKITGLGKELSNYPLSPRLGKIMSLGVHESTLLPQVIAVVSGLAIQEIFYAEAQLDMINKEQEDGKIYLLEHQREDDARDQRKQAFGRARATLSKHDKTSDALKLLTAVSMYTAADDKESFCRDYFLRPKAMFEVSQLQRQLTGIVKANNPALQLPSTSKTSSKQVQTLNAIAAAGYIDQVAIRTDLAPNPPEIPMKPRRAIDVPYIPLIPLTDRPSSSLMEKAVFIHPSSLLAKQSPKDLPQYVVYSHLQKSQAHAVGTETVPKTRMFPLTPVDGRTLVELAKDTALLEYGRPVPQMKIQELRGAPKRRECWVTTELRAGPGLGYGWPLPAVHVRQVMDVKTSSGWRVEEMLGS